MPFFHMMKLSEPQVLLSVEESDQQAPGYSWEKTPTSMKKGNNRCEMARGDNCQKDKLESP